MRLFSLVPALALAYDNSCFLTQDGAGAEGDLERLQFTYSGEVLPTSIQVCQIDQYVTGIKLNYAELAPPGLGTVDDSCTTRDLD